MSDVPWTPPILLDAPTAVTITATQARVLSLLCRGLSNQQIAREMFITIDTVKTHICRLYRLLGVLHRAHAVSVAMSGQTWITVRDGRAAWKRSAA